MSSTKQLYSNNAETTAAIQIQSSDTQITVVDASGFSNPGGTGRFILVTLENSGVIEIVKISNISGNVMTVYGGLAGRGQEGTAAATFPVGTLVENRLTAATLDEFVPNGLYLPLVASVDNLSDPASMDAKAYMAGYDDGGGLVLSYAASSTLWNFPSYRLVYSGSASSGSTTTAVIGTTLDTYDAGKYIVQFTNGSVQGYPRAITGIAGTTISWGTALPNAVSTNTLEVYQSNFSAAGGGSGGGGGGYRGNIASVNGTTMTVTTTPTFGALVDGMEINGFVSDTNYSSTTPTLNPNAIGAKTIAKLDDVALSLSELQGEVTLRYNQALDKWILVSGASSSNSADDIQKQAATAFTTGGTSTAFTLTPTPAITSNTTNHRFRVKFHAAAGTTPTLNVSGQGPLNLKYKNSKGTKQPLTALQAPINWIADVENDGTDWVVINTADLVHDQTLAKYNLVDAATINMDEMVNYSAFDFSMTSSRTLGFPSTPPAAGTYYIDVTIDSTGGWIMSFHANYHLVPNGSVWQSNANSVNRIWLVVRTTSLIDVYIENISY